MARKQSAPPQPKPKREGPPAISEQEPEPEIEINDEPPETANLMQRIIWVRKHVLRLGKDASVSAGTGGNYKAISHDKVTAALRPLLCAAGICSWMSCEAFEDADTGAATGKGRKIVQHRAQYIITFANALKPDESITIKQPAYADDYGDKAPGKAASYAMKYALLKTFMVETGEEDEARVAPEETRRSVVRDDENMMLELWAVAEECFGDDAKEMLGQMSERRFNVATYGDIPQDRYADAIRSLRRKREQMSGENL